MNWVLIKPLENANLVHDFEKKYRITFPKSYIEVVKNNNLGRPRPNVFDTAASKERIAKCLLSFDPQHQENIWDLTVTLKKQLPPDVIPFMVDQFGNYICFYFDILSEEANIVFWDVESQKVDKVAETFEEFVNRFYEV